MEEQRSNQTLQVMQTGHKLTSISLIPNYDHIELSEDEVTELIRAAKKAKALKIEELAYAEKVRKSLEKKSFSAEQLADYVGQKYPKLKIDDQNKKIFSALCLYFSNDPDFELLEEGFSLDKGILLNGPVGCGKTFLMDIFAINTKLPYRVVECLEVAEDYSKKGEEYLQKYFSLSPAYPQQNLGHDLIGWCYDDLGWEDIKKHFGNNMNTMEYVIGRGYRNDMKGNIHVTTNLGGDDIAASYGPRLRSRMREMFNQLVFHPDSADRRV